MSARKRLQTLARDQHTGGRLQLHLSLTNSDQVLCVGVGGAQDLQLPPRHFEDVVVRCRCMVLPARPVDVVNSLLSRQLQPHNPLLKQTQTHKSGSSPLFNEDFLFDLTHLKDLRGYRLYVSLISGSAVDAKDNLCIGCMSFDLAQLAHKSAVFEEQGPTWYWVFSRQRGLIANEQVARRERTVQVQEADVQLAGLMHSAPNACINGDYLVQDEKLGDRPSFKHATLGFCLYYTSKRKAWVVSDQTGDPAPYAYVEDNAQHPGLISECWWVFNKGREFTTFAQVGQANRYRGEFVKEPDLKAFLAGPYAALRLQQEEARVKKLEAERVRQEEEARQLELLEESKVLELERKRLLAELAEEEALEAERLAASRRAEQASIAARVSAEESEAALKQLQQSLRTAEQQVRAQRDRERLKMQEQHRLQREADAKEAVRLAKEKELMDARRREEEAKLQAEQDARKAAELRQARLAGDRERARLEAQRKMQEERELLRRQRESAKTGKEWKRPVITMPKKTSKSKLTPADEDLRDTHVPEPGKFLLTKPLRSAR
eukprot:m.246371 g.246371  ORF g.246371 m.246371 type:complete len:549 (+) comp19065_c0_seq5:452-2098(+)